MRETALLDDMEALVNPEISLMGFELIEISFSGGVLRLTLDKPGGVTLDDCVAVNRRVSALLDTRDFIDGSYRLEVSSPGLNRRLKTRRDFEHFSGRKVKILTPDGVHRGTIKGMTGDEVILVEEGKDMKLLLDSIVKANLEFDF